MSIRYFHFVIRRLNLQCMQTGQVAVFVCTEMVEIPLRSKNPKEVWRQTKMILRNLGIGKAQMNIAILIKILPSLGQYVTEVAKINQVYM